MCSTLKLALKYIWPQLIFSTRWQSIFSFHRVLTILEMWMKSRFQTNRSTWFSSPMCDLKSKYYTTCQPLAKNVNLENKEITPQYRSTNLSRINISTALPCTACTHRDRSRPSGIHTDCSPRWLFSDRCVNPRDYIINLPFYSIIHMLKCLEPGKNSVFHCNLRCEKSVLTHCVVAVFEL